MRYTKLVLFILSAYTTTCAHEIPAVTVVSVADLLLQRAKIVYPEQKTEESYLSFSLEGAKESARSCPRVHQLLFNEQVTIIRQEKDEVLVKVPNIFYEACGKRCNTYWAHKKNFVPLKQLKNCSHVPSPIQFKAPYKTQKQTIVTLLFPFEDKKGKRTFSAGTRFVRAKKEIQNQKFVFVYALDSILKIPRQLCLIEKPGTQKNKRKQLVSLLRKWANCKNGFIPYVWGGCSFTHPYSNKMIRSSIMVLQSGRKVSVFWKNSRKKTATGLDCAGAVMRAAQIFGLPYFFKNSVTALKNLKKVTSYDKLQDGDLMHISGHLMIVSDKKRNKLIEARSHWHGFGKFHETTLENVFRGITNYQQLCAASKKGTVLQRIDRTGNPVDRPKITFLKLPA